LHVKADIYKVSVNVYFITQPRRDIIGPVVTGIDAALLIIVKQTMAIVKNFFFICAVGLWVLRPLLAYCTSPGLMIGYDDCGEIGGMKIGKGNRSTRRKPTPAPLCPPQIPHD
jgi:hypothetical protein